MTDVEDSKLTVSFSQLQSFARCEKAWEFAYIDKWTPKEKSKNLEIGSLVHELVGIYYSGGTWNAIEYKLTEYMATSPHSDSLQILDTAGWIMRRYIEDFSPVADLGWHTTEVEFHFEIPLVSPNGLEYVLQGYVDRIKVKDGRIWIEETKTVGQGKFWTPVQCMMDAQTATYAAALRTIGWPVTGIVYNMLNTHMYKDRAGTPVEKLFRREKTYRTNKELDSILFNSGLLVERMASHTGPYIRNLKRDCDYCFFQEPCIMGIKGIDPTAFLVNDFVKKVDTRKVETPT